MGRALATFYLIQSEIIKKLFINEASKYQSTPSKKTSASNYLWRSKSPSPSFESYMRTRQTNVSLNDAFKSTPPC